MKSEQRYKNLGKPALLIVPSTGTTKRGWLNRLKSVDPKTTDFYHFRILTENSDIPAQLNKAQACFKHIVVLNNALNSVNRKIAGRWVQKRTAGQLLNIHLTRSGKSVYLTGVNADNWLDRVQELA